MPHEYITAAKAQAETQQVNKKSVQYGNAKKSVQYAEKVSMQSAPSSSEKVSERSSTVLIAGKRASVKTGRESVSSQVMLLHTNLDH